MTLKFGEERLSRFGALGVMIIVALILLPAANASAHTPLFSNDNFNLQNAYTVKDPAKSWAVYANLPSDSEAAYYKFHMDVGERIDITLLSPQNPSSNHFLPSFVLMLPGSSANDSVPSYVEVPSGCGKIVVNGSIPATATFEPFTPGWFYQLAEMNMSAPASGTYYVAVYDPQGGGNFGLPVGYIEGYTIPEILALPNNLQQIFVWEGQSTFVVLLPFILALILGGILVYWSNIRSRGPKDNISKWAAAFGALAFIGYAGININQIALALSKTGWNSGAFVSIMFIILPLVLGFLSLRYAMKARIKTTLKYRVALVIIGLVGLMLWTGLYLGPALLILAATLPPYKQK